MEKVVKNHSQNKAFWVTVAYEHVISGKLFLSNKNILKTKTFGLLAFHLISETFYWCPLPFPPNKEAFCMLIT